MNIELVFLQGKDKWEVAPKMSTMIVFTDGSSDPVKAGIHCAMSGRFQQGT